jgi:WD40 repeat protein
MHRGFVNALQFDPTTGQLYSAGSDSTIRKWNTATAAGQQQLQPVGFSQALEHHCDWVNDLALVHDGTRRTY